MSYERFCSEFPLPDNYERFYSGSRLRNESRQRRRAWLVLLLFVGSLFAIAGLAHGSTKPLDAVVIVRTSQGGGSGVIVSSDGQVLTAEHVIGKGQVQAVLYRGTSYAAKAVHSPEKNGIDEAFVLKFDPGFPAPFLPVAKSAPKTGDLVSSHGYPWLEYYSTNLGQVTEIESNGQVRVNFWAIEGNSGGPLLNAKGEIVGLCSTRDPLPGERDPLTGELFPVKPGSTWIGLKSIQTALKQPSVSEVAPNPRGYLLYFGSTFCSPCQRMLPIVDRLQGEGLPIQKVNADTQVELTNRYGVRSVPTWIVIVDGKEVDRKGGALTENEIRKLLSEIPAEAPAPFKRSALSFPCSVNETTIGELFKSDPQAPAAEVPPKAGVVAVEPGGESDPAIDWSLVKIVVLRSNPGLSDETGSIIAALQDRLGGPFRRRLQELTQGKADVQLVHQQASPDRFAAVQAAVGREAGSLLVVVMTKQQDLGFIKGQIASQVQSALSGYIDGKVPVEIVSQRVHPSDYEAVETALTTPESKDPADNAPWWIAGVSSLAAFAVGYLLRFIQKRRAKTNA